MKPVIVQCMLNYIGCHFSTVLYIHNLYIHPILPYVFSESILTRSLPDPARSLHWEDEGGHQ